MPQFTFQVRSPNFVARLQAAVATLPVIGDPNPSDVIELAHYSPNVAISSFDNQHLFSWTNKVSDMEMAIGWLTGLEGRRFNAIYLIRLGVGSTYEPRKYGAGPMEEYAIDRDVLQGEFAVLPLTYNAATRMYA